MAEQGFGPGACAANRHAGSVVSPCVMGPEKKERGHSDDGRPGLGVLKLGCSGKAFLLKKGGFSWDLKGKEEPAWHRTWEDTALVGSGMDGAQGGTGRRSPWSECRKCSEEGTGDQVGWGQGWTL